MSTTVLITAGGTGSAFRLSETVKQHFPGYRLVISDTNPEELVASAVNADVFYRVPPVKEKGYRDHMYALLKECGADVIIPLIPWEQEFFAPDCSEFAALGVKSAAAELKTLELNDKKHLYEICASLDIPTVPLLTYGSIPEGERIIVKERSGFGSLGIRRMKAGELGADPGDGYVIQPDLSGKGSLPDAVEEVTLECVLSAGKLYTIARRRLEAKGGVCTKADFLPAEAFIGAAEKLTKAFAFPPAFNLQFVHAGDEWLLMDVNLRLAAGGSASEAAGFQISRALVALLTGKEADSAWLKRDESVKTVLRVYREVVVR